ncbi:hypothetical protein [Oceanicola sp. S124]|uniref:hypothetical protein n=1 Tax=Oceanicola sp. S124 TaxID=1042378 RepID=UPI000255A995|nr:hypothetical protein [Oceanicola sp. S124]
MTQCPDHPDQSSPEAILAQLSAQEKTDLLSGNKVVAGETLMVRDMVGAFHDSFAEEFRHQSDLDQRSRADPAVKEGDRHRHQDV